MRDRFVVDYGFWGCMMPVFANLADFRSVRNKLKENEQTIPAILKKLTFCP